MKIKYNVEIINDSKLYLDEELYTTKKELYNLTTLEGSNFNFKLEAEKVTLIDQLELTDPVRVFQSVNQSVDSEAFKKIKYQIKKANKLCDSVFSTVTVFESKREVIFITITDLGIVELVQVKDFKDSSEVEVETLVSNLYYFVIKNEFTITPTAFFKPTISNLAAIQSGFCSLQVLRVETCDYLQVSEEGEYLYYSAKGQRLSSPFNFYVDGVDTNNYVSTCREFNILSVQDNLNTLEVLRKEMIKDNIILIYKIGEDGIQVFDHMVISKSQNLKYNLTSTQDWLESDIEFKKQYTFKVYNTPISLNYLEAFSLYDELVLKELEANISIYSKNVVILDD